MAMYVYVTLLLAALIHPFVVVIWPYFYGDSMEDLAMDLIIIAPSGWLISLIWFVPCMPIGRFCLTIVVKTRTGTPIKFLLWLAMVGVVVAATCMLFGIIFSMTDGLLPVTELLVLTIWIVSALRYRFFSEMIKQNLY